MMSPDVLEGVPSPISVPTMNLYGSIRSLATQPIRPVVTHADLHTQLLLDLVLRMQFIHLVCRLPNQKPQHGALSCEFYEWKLYALVVGEGLTKGLAFVCVGYGLVYTVKCCAEGGCSLTDTVLVDEGLGYSEAVVEWTNYGG